MHQCCYIVKQLIPTTSSPNQAKRLHNLRTNIINSSPRIHKLAPVMKLHFLPLTKSKSVCQLHMIIINYTNFRKKMMSNNMNILAMMKVFVMVLLAYILSMAISASADEVHELKSLVVPSFKVGCLTRS